MRRAVNCVPFELPMLGKRSEQVDRSELAALVAKAVADAPVLPTADPGLELSFAMLRVLTRRHGASFSEEVRREIEDKADRMDASNLADDRAQASDIRSIMDG
jgi:type VI protein secretion system component VasF